MAGYIEISDCDSPLSSNSVDIDLYDNTTDSNDVSSPTNSDKSNNNDCVEYIGPFTKSYRISTHQLSKYGGLAGFNIPIGMLYELRYTWKKMSCDKEVAKLLFKLQPGKYKGIKEQNVRRKINSTLHKINTLKASHNPKLYEFLTEIFTPPIAPKGNYMNEFDSVSKDTIHVYSEVVRGSTSPSSKNKSIPCIDVDSGIVLTNDVNDEIDLTEDILGTVQISSPKEPMKTDILITKSSSEAGDLITKSSSEAEELITKSSSEAGDLITKSSSEAEHLITKSSSKAEHLDIISGENQANVVHKSNSCVKGSSPKLDLNENKSNESNNIIQENSADLPKKEIDMLTHTNADNKNSDQDMNACFTNSPSISVSNSQTTMYNCDSTSSLSYQSASNISYSNCNIAKHRTVSYSKAGTSTGTETKKNKKIEIISKRESEAIKTVHSLGKDQWEHGEAGNLPRYPPDIKIPRSDVNYLLSCGICKCYIYNATTVVECMHTFCRKCIYYHIERSKHCPTCHTLIHQSNPSIALKQDKIYREILQKFLPSFYNEEKKQEKIFYEKCKNDNTFEPVKKRRKSDAKSEVKHQLKPVKTTAWLSVEFDFIGCNEKYLSLINKVKIKKPLARIPFETSVKHLQKFLAIKLPLDESLQALIFHNGCLLHDDMTMGGMISLFYADVKFSADAIIMLEYGIVPKGRDYFQDLQVVPNCENDLPEPCSSTDMEGQNQQGLEKDQQSLKNAEPELKHSQILDSLNRNSNTNSMDLKKESSRLEAVECLESKDQIVGSINDASGMDVTRTVDEDANNSMDVTRTIDEDANNSTIQDDDNSNLKRNFYICSYCAGLVPSVSLIMHVAKFHGDLSAGERIAIKSNSLKWFGSVNDYISTKKPRKRIAKSYIRAKICCLCDKVQHNIHQHMSYSHNQLSNEAKRVNRNGSIAVNIFPIHDDYESQEIRSCFYCNYMQRQIVMHINTQHYQSVEKHSSIAILKKCPIVRLVDKQHKETFLKCVKDI